MTKFESYDLHSWTDKHHGQTCTVWGTLYKSDRLVFASSEDELKGALAVLDGNSPGVGSDAPLRGNVKPGTILLMRATALGKADLHVNWALAKYLEAVRFSLGEDEGKSFFSARVVCKNEDVAEELKDVVNGAEALAILHVGDNAKAKKLVNALHVTTKGRSLNLNWKASADEVWNLVEKHAKRMAQWRGKMGRPAEKPRRQRRRSPRRARWKRCRAEPPYRPGAGPGPGPGFPNLNLTKEQEAKFADLRKEYEPKFKEAREKMENILTADQKKARDEVFKKAREAGKFGKEVWDEAQAAMKLTDDQKTKMADAWKETGNLYKEFGEKLRAS